MKAESLLGSRDCARTSRPPGHGRDQRPMSIASSGHLIDVLRQTALLNREQLGELARLAEVRYSEARALAKLLVQRGWLTVYQANQLLLDKASDLVVGPYHVLERI